MKHSVQAIISVGEPWDFEANDGPNRLLVDHVGWLTGPNEVNWGSRYLLLRVVNPFQYRSELVEFLTASPRYHGITPEMLAESGGTMGIARVRPGVRLIDGDQFKTDDVDYFMIGNLTFLTGAA